MYILPSDGADAELDTNGTIAASVANFETWFRGQTGGQGLRLDTYQGQVDVTFFRSTKTDSEIAANGLYVRDELEREIRASGFTDPNKIYAAYYGGSTSAPNTCGGGAWPPTLPGTLAALYLGATFGAGYPCYTPAQSFSGLQIMDLAIVHEVMHTLGFVPACAPHFTRAGHVSDSPNDLLYAGDAPWTPGVLDVGHDDYFGAHIPGCLDLAQSQFLEGNSPPPPPPPVSCVVPNVKGKRLAPARRAIVASHCAVGRVTRAHSRAKLKGRVVKQSPAPRTTHPRGTKVRLALGTGR